MRTYIAAKVHAALVTDSEIGPGKALFLDGGTNATDATADRLTRALEERRPGLVVTTSHGLTGPLNNASRMAATLGLPVGQDDAAVDLDRLLDKWQPNGAIWYCHACCSAGADQPSAFADLFDESAPLRSILTGIATVGPCVAPLPSRLLSGSRPCRAFIGHVEPTFDWTLRDPGNGQVITKPIVDAVYPNLFRPRTTLGFAFKDAYATVGSYLANWDLGRAAYDAGSQNIADLLRLQLAARDLQSMVILGDPAATLIP
jgi:hypothetical protein